MRLKNKVKFDGDMTLPVAKFTFNGRSSQEDPETGSVDARHQ